MKKVLCLVMSFLMVLGCINAFAEETEKIYGDFVIVENEDNITITRVTQSGLINVTVPGEINGKKVTLTPNLFEGMASLESVIIEEGIVEIPENAFYKCINLKSVKLPENLVTIGKYAFSETGIEEIDIKNVEVIDMCSFKNCTKLIQVVHSGNLKELESYAFENCKKLSLIDLRSVEMIGSRVFVNCNSLEYINIEKLNDWIGLSNEDVNRETMDVKTIGVYNRDPRREIKPVTAWTSFESLNGLKTIRINLTEVGTSELNKAMFSDCSNIETVIFEHFIRPGDWEFYITEGIALMKLKKLPEKMTIYGRGDVVKEYAESIGVPFKELIDVNLNGERIWMDDCLPYIKQGRTMVPMRAIFEALGATVTWDDEAKAAIGVKDGVEVKITIGENKLYKNGEAIELDCAAEITNDRTMVPVRAISEAFGCIVEWENDTKTVEITQN